MSKISYMTNVRKHYVLSTEAERVVVHFLLGGESVRSAGEKLGCSHQQVINLATTMTRQWIGEGKLKFIGDGSTPGDYAQDETDTPNPR